MKTIVFVSSVVLGLGCAAAYAAPVSPTSYDMVNGNSGSYNYWDDTYSGAGNNQQDGAALSGGLGDLTDGVIATQNWSAVESPIGPNGPYVGWSNTNPVITFNFAQVYEFASATFHFDDSNGFGGVSAPAALDVNGVGLSIADPAGSNPFSVTIDLSTLTTDTLVATISRRSAWVFLSEVSFETSTTPVPVPAGVILLASGLGGLGALARKRSRTQS